MKKKKQIKTIHKKSIFFYKYLYSKLNKPN